MNPQRASRPRIHLHTAVPANWNDLLARCPQTEFTATSNWLDSIAAHYRGASALYLVAEFEGQTVGGLPALVRPHRGLVRLESSLEGTVAGPQIPADLPDSLQADTFAALCGALADHVGGRTIVAAVTLAPAGMATLDAMEPATRWQRLDYHTALVDCRDGLEHVERKLWTNNRRNERNRGLKRGCTLQAEYDRDAVTAWYPLYAAKSGEWAQTPVPLALLQDLLETNPDRCVLNTVRLEGTLIAGHFCFRSRDRLVAWQGAARADLQRSHFPTTLAYWQDLRHACENGLEAVDFGGCVGRDSLWDFKRRCGARPEPRCQLLVRSSLGRLLQAAAVRWRGRSR